MVKKVQSISSIKELDHMNVEIDERWAVEKPSLSMHSIHAYPAKFPPFLAAEAFQYAMDEGVVIRSVADIFCGCGTTALESKIRGISFWGCDINPVAVMITRAKTADYDLEKLEQHFHYIIELYYESRNGQDNVYESANERLKYWFDEKAYTDLYYLYNSIEKAKEKAFGNEWCFFQCVFSSILKTCSRWLQKSIKPQIDPKKQPADVIQEFQNKYKQVYKAVKQINEKGSFSEKQISIENGNFLELNVPVVLQGL